MPQIQSAEDHKAVGDFVAKTLSAESVAAGYSYAPKPVVLQVVDADRIVGGLTGATNWDWLYIETLAVDPAYQNRGYGRELVAEAERIAQARGCCGSWVDTFTFQSPDFYVRLGYQRFGELPQYPADQSRVFLMKLFDGLEQDATFR